MTEERKPAPIIDLADRRLQRAVADAQALLAPEVEEALDAEELARHVAGQLSELPPDQRSLMRRKVALSIHDLEALVGLLRGELSELAGELRKVSQHSSAAAAYGRAPHSSKNRS